LDKNNLLSIIKTLTELLHCPSCGQPYTIEEVQYISQVQGYCLLQVSCRSCKQPVWINFFVEKDQKIARRQIKISPIEAEITSDEVIEFHNKIKTFDGNFKKIFRTKA
jgi:hypothetical protein